MNNGPNVTNLWGKSGISLGLMYYNIGANVLFPWGRCNKYIGANVSRGNVQVPKKSKDD